MKESRVRVTRADVARMAQVSETIGSYVINNNRYEMCIRDRGYIREGYRADFVVLDPENRVVSTYVGGRKVF